MQSKQLTLAQARRIHEALFPGVNYLVRMRNRMDKVGFHPDDPLFQRVCKAYNASWELSNEMHRLSCKSGMGLLARE